MKFSVPALQFSLFVVLSGCCSLAAMADVTVASLNPVVTDLAKQVGGARITVIELMKAGENPHAYTPNPQQLIAAQQAQIILAAGKGLESYLPDVRDNLTQGQRLLEVGETIPSLMAAHDCSGCSGHAGHTAVDPHWWQSIKNIKRAARVIAVAFAELSPQDSDYFNARSREYCQKMDQLESWARKKISRIPRNERVLTTAHNSFGYFCRDFGFEAAPIQGLSSEITPEPQQLTAIVQTIKLKNIKAVFPEKNVNPGVLEAIVRETGVGTGGYLLAGGPDSENPTCEAMLHHNVATIVKALTPGSE